MHRHKAQRHQVERHQVERHQSSRIALGAYESQLTAPGFVRLFTDLLNEPQHPTHLDAYRAAEDYHKKQYGAARFASYHSFRQAKKAYESRG